MKKIAFAIVAIVLALAAFNSYKSNDSITLNAASGDTYEVTGIVTDVEKDAVVFEANMPDGSIHIFAAHGQGYEAGQLVKITLADNDTPERYNDDTLQRAYIIR